MTIFLVNKARHNNKSQSKLKCRKSKARKDLLTIRKNYSRNIYKEKNSLRDTNPNEKLNIRIKFYN